MPAAVTPRGFWTIVEETSMVFYEAGKCCTCARFRACLAWVMGYFDCGELFSPFFSCVLRSLASVSQAFAISSSARLCSGLLMVVAILRHSFACRSYSSTLRTGTLPSL